MDLTGKAKRLNDQYPFTSGDGIHAFLKNRDRLRESTFLHGGVEALILLLDFDWLESNAELTDRQRELLAMYYDWGYTKTEIGQMLGISHQTVSEQTRAAVDKLAKAYRGLTGGETFEH